MKDNVEFVLKNKHPKYSENIRKWFTRKDNRKCNKVVLFDWHNNGSPQLWFADTDWGSESNPAFVGVRVSRVAAFGLKEKTGYPTPQKGLWKDVTDEFWEKYRKGGKLAFPEIWHIKTPETKSHAEYSTV